jgi:hypothetical protein
VAAARGSQVRQRSRHHRGAVSRRPAAPVHELQLLATAPCQTIDLDHSKLEFRALRGFRGGGAVGVGWGGMMYLAGLGREESRDDEAHGVLGGGRRRRSGGGGHG